MSLPTQTAVNGPVTTDPEAALAPLAPPLPTPKDRLAEGRAKRAQVSRSAHARWEAPANRADPIALLEESSRLRLQQFVPIRYGRMASSPFAYFRGSPIVMAHDLAATPVSGIRVQASGDAHLMNFGLYASPERNLLFDLNDFDETLAAPWEWDVKRLAASCVVAGRTYSISNRDCADAARAGVESYRQHMRAYSRMRLLDVWYSRVDVKAALKVFRGVGRKDLSRTFNKSRRRNSLQALSKLAAVTDGCLHVVHNPPLVQRVTDPHLSETVRRFFKAYYSSLQEDRRTLLERYRFVDFALKVVGVGSVGTRCFIILLDGSHSEDPLFLQIKEAQASVLEAVAGRSQQRNHGHRVVSGQRLLQSASDIFLGWAGDGDYHYYVRQLRDMKGSADLEKMSGGELIDYAALCGWVLARAHARSGDPALIAGYLGKSDRFDEAIVDFATAYADQTERDFEALNGAIKAGRIPAEMGV
jgi:uncharacterized protein (DUF2252 family)